MPKHAKRLIAQAYSAFNRRDIDSALALMSESVSWPKAIGRRACLSGKKRFGFTGPVSGRSLIPTWNHLR